MTDYLYIEGLNIKVQLLSAKSSNGTYTIKFGDNKTLNLSHFMESWMALKIYKGSSDVNSWMRGIWDDITPVEICDFRKKFQAEHLSRKVEAYCYEKVPLIATANRPLAMFLSMFKGPVYMTVEQEKEVMALINKTPNKINRQPIVNYWFSRFCREEGYQARLKRDRNIQAEELAETFCEYHGISYDGLCRIAAHKLAAIRDEQLRLERENPKPKPTKWQKFKAESIETIGNILGPVVMAVVACGVAWLLTSIGDDLMDSDNGILMTFGIFFWLGGVAAGVCLVAFAFKMIFPGWRQNS